MAWCVGYVHLFKALYQRWKILKVMVYCTSYADVEKAIFLNVRQFFKLS